MNFNNTIKITAILLSVLIIAFSFAGCSKNKDEATADTSLNADDMFTDNDLNESLKLFKNTSTITLEDNSAKSSSKFVTVKDNTVTITKAGTYILSGSLSDGQIIVETDKTEKVQLILNNVNITSSTSSPIYVKQADKVFITLKAGTSNTLTSSGEFVQTDDNNIDSVIFSKDDLTINGTGTLNISSVCGHGIVSKDDLVLCSGTVNIDALNHGICGKDSVRIASGKITVSAGKDGIHSKNDDDKSTGFVYIAGGTININKSEEGIEGQNITIAGGDITLKANDDGLNASSGGDSSGNNMPFQGMDAGIDSDCFIKISGGTLNIDAKGDGIDSNGSLYISGGTTYVNGPVSGGDAALDYAKEAQITGGTIIATGSAEMAAGFSSSSTQCSILYIFSDTQKAGTEISLKDSSGKTLLNFTPSKEYRAINISCADLKQGNTYTVSAGDISEEITLSDISTSIGANGMGVPTWNMGDKPSPNQNGKPPEMPDGTRPDNTGDFDPGNQGRPEAPEGFDPNMKPGNKPDKTTDKK